MIPWMGEVLYRNMRSFIHFVGCLENVSGCAGVSPVLCAAFMEACLTHYGAYMVHQYPYLVHTGSERGSACLP
jgi:hypothetical protein